MTNPTNTESLQYPCPECGAPAAEPFQACVDCKAPEVEVCAWDDDFGACGPVYRNGLCRHCYAEAHGVTMRGSI